MSDDCKNFIKSCLEKNPTKRLGLNGIEEIINHPWFEDINIGDIMRKKAVPQFKPTLSKDILDVSNFDKVFTSDEAVNSVLDKVAAKKII